MSIKVEIDANAIQDKLNLLINDKDTMKQVHTEFARYMNPYVPMREGDLAKSTEITAEGVTYRQPYAHYQYVGLVYGPNIPIVQDGIIVGWFSPPGEGSKHPTGEYLHYSKELHPLASSEWDKAMIRDKRDEFSKQITEVLKKRAETL